MYNIDTPVLFSDLLRLVKNDFLAGRESAKVLHKSGRRIPLNGEVRLLKGNFLKLIGANSQETIFQF